MWPSCPTQAQHVLDAVGAVASRRARTSPAGRRPATLDEVPEGLRSGCAAELDAGRLSGIPSTVIDFSGAEPVVLREGAALVGRGDRRASRTRSRCQRRLSPAPAGGLASELKRLPGAAPRATAAAAVVVPETLRASRCLDERGGVDLGRRQFDAFGRPLDREGERACGGSGQSQNPNSQLPPPPPPPRCISTISGGFSGARRASDRRRPPPVGELDAEAQQLGRELRVVPASPWRIIGCIGCMTERPGKGSLRRERRPVPRSPQE